MYGVEELAKSSIHGVFNSSDLDRFVVLESCDDPSNCFYENRFHALNVLKTFLDSGIRLFTDVGYNVSFVEREYIGIQYYLPFERLNEIQDEVNKSLIGASFSFLQRDFRHSSLSGDGALSDMLVLRGTGNDPSCQSPFSYYVVNETHRRRSCLRYYKFTRDITNLPPNARSLYDQYVSSVRLAEDDTLLFVGGFYFWNRYDKRITFREPHLNLAGSSTRQHGNRDAECFRVHGTYWYYSSEPLPGGTGARSAKGTSIATPNVFASMVVLWMAVKDVYGVELTGRQLSRLYKSTTVRSTFHRVTSRLTGLGVADLRVLLERDSQGNVISDSNGRTKLIPLEEIMDRIDGYECSSNL